MNRSQAARELRREHPDWTLRQIANAIGCIHQNVRQALKGAGLPTRAVRTYKHTCNRCGKRLERAPLSGLCRRCLYPHDQRPCSECGTILDRPLSHFRDNNPRYKGRHFCNYLCSGRYAGKHYGWGRRLLPESAALDALAIGDTLRIRCRWRHNPVTGCWGRHWADNRKGSNPGYWISIRCDKTWCSITKRALLTTVKM